MTASIEIRQSVGQMVAAYIEANEEIRQAYKLLETAQARLDSAFGDKYSRFQVLPQQYGRGDVKYDPPRDAKPMESTALTVRARIKTDAWRHIAERLEMRSLMSTERTKELDEQLSEPAKLPDLTPEAITAMIDGLHSNLDTYMTEAVKEVFEFLRPRMSELKTNSEFEVGEKVILRYSYNAYYSTPRIEYGTHMQDYHNLDNIFHLLDGKGPVKSHRGPLIDAVEHLPAFGETATTAYFSAKPYKNGRLHIRFLRPDLLAKLNQIAGGNRLKPA
jgi:hypothetical protein